MKKVFSILMVAFAMTAMVACGEKDNGNNRSGGTDIEESTDYMPGGVWQTDNDEGTYNLQLGDESDMFQYTIIRNNEDNQHLYIGNYKYSNATQKGTVELSDYQGAGQGYEYAGKAEFTYNDGSITVKFLGETVTLPKVLK
ncbi:MAG: hypothetical protein K6E96_05330 [Bacteroidales bacterium]|nr:hypothetical protein [Bacteroidales bacterium]